MCLKCYTHTKQVLATHIWNNNHQKKRKKIRRNTTAKLFALNADAKVLVSNSAFIDYYDD